MSFSSLRSLMTFKRSIATTSSLESAASKARTKKSIPLYLRPQATSPNNKTRTSTNSDPTNGRILNVEEGSSHSNGTTTTLISPATSTKQKKVSEGLASLRVNDWAEPPLVAQARAKTVKQRSVWESYLVLPPKTRLFISLGLFAFALVGLYGGDYLVPETEEEKELKILQQQQRASTTTPPTAATTTTTASATS